MPRNHWLPAVGIPLSVVSGGMIAAQGLQISYRAYRQEGNAKRKAGAHSLTVRLMFVAWVTLAEDAIILNNETPAFVNGMDGKRVGDASLEAEPESVWASH